MSCEIEVFEIDKKNADAEKIRSYVRSNLPNQCGSGVNRSWGRDVVDYNLHWMVVAYKKKPVTLRKGTKEAIELCGFALVQEREVDPEEPMVPRHLYINLVCAGTKGYGRILMERVHKLACDEGFDIVKLSALPEVRGYYPYLFDYVESDNACVKCRRGDKRCRVKGNAKDGYRMTKCVRGECSTKKKTTTKKAVPFWLT